MVVNQLLKYGEFGIVLFDNFQVTERTRNQFVLTHTRVRIPPSAPRRTHSLRVGFVQQISLPVAQLDSASDSDSEGRRFESYRVGQSPKSLENTDFIGIFEAFYFLDYFIFATKITKYNNY